MTAPPRASAETTARAMMPASPVVGVAGLASAAGLTQTQAENIFSQLGVQTATSKEIYKLVNQKYKNIVAYFESPENRFYFILQY